MAILRRSESAMLRALYGAKLMEKKRTEDLMVILELKETVVQMVKANGVRWYGHLLWRDDGHVLRKALEFEMKGKRKRTTKEDVEDTSGEGEQECRFGEKGCYESSEMESGSWRDCCQSGVDQATPIYEDKPRSNWIDWL